MGRAVLERKKEVQRVVANHKCLGADLLVLSTKLQEGALQQHFLESYFTEMASPLLQLRVQKTFSKEQVIHVLKCPMCPLQGTDEMSLTWSVKVQLLLVLLMIHEALSQGNAVSCRAEPMGLRRGMVWRTLTQVSPSPAVAIPPRSCARSSMAGHGLCAGMQPNRGCCSVVATALGQES